MSAVTLAPAPEDAAALEAAGAHHARLAGELTGRVTMLLAAAERDPEAAERIRAGLVALCEREILPHTAAEEAVLHPAARRLPGSRLLIESMAADHSCLTALVDALRTAPTPVDAAADARALHVFFEEHVARETGLVLPLLALAPDIRLATLWREVRDRCARHTPVDGPDQDRAVR
ncbi:hemerythrin domain-containing protein [Streptomyces thermoalcalitolerans]|uniref:Hemerythrin-like domain-containing protein n=1 Tax=Streptomyces thermoalcalitolerans TaxID=65605 RepID=A0ABP3YWI9_9ACTN